MRKFCVLPIFVFLFLGSFVYAQKLNKGTPKAEVWKEFTAEDGSFKILFPKPPQTNSPLDLPVGKYYLSSVSPTEKYLLEFKDYPAPIIDDVERQMRLELGVPLPAMPKDLPMPSIPSAKGSLPTPNGWELKKIFRVVRTQNYSGVEFTFDSERENTTNTIRIFIVKQREFHLKITTPLLGKLPPLQRQSYQRKISAFFNSFIIGEIPPAKYQPVPSLPEDFGSILQANTYSNKYFGFKINLPPNWKIQHLHQGKMSPSEKIEYEKKDITQRWWRRNNPTLIFAVKEDKPSNDEDSGLLVQAQRPDFPDISLERFVESKIISVEAFDRKPILPVQHITINGQEFLMFEAAETKSSELEPDLPLLKERLYITDRNGVFLTFSLKYRDTADNKFMLESMKTLTFFDSARGE